MLGDHSVGLPGSFLLPFLPSEAEGSALGDVLIRQQKSLLLAACGCAKIFPSNWRGVISGGKQVNLSVFLHCFLLMDFVYSVGNGTTVNQWKLRNKCWCVPIKYALILKCFMLRKDCLSVVTFQSYFPLFFLFHVKLLRSNARLPFWGTFYFVLTPRTQSSSIQDMDFPHVLS